MAQQTPRWRNSAAPAHALYRHGRICILFDVDKSTLTRWRKQGKLPPYTEIAGVKGLTGQQILDFYAQWQRDV